MSTDLDTAACGSTPKSPSFPNGLSGNRSEAEVRAARRLTIVDVINQGVRIPAPMGSHELQLIREHKLQQRFFAARDEILAAVDAVNKGSAFVKIDRESVFNVLADECPSKDHWDNLIASEPGGIR